MKQMYGTNYNIFKPKCSLQTKRRTLYLIIPSLTLKVIKELNLNDLSFSYKNSKYDIKSHPIQDTTYLFKNWENNETVLVTPEDYSKGNLPEGGYRYLGVIRKEQHELDQQSYKICFPSTLCEFSKGDTQVLQTCPYLVVGGKIGNSNPSPQLSILLPYVLEVGDFLKLNHIDFQIVEIQTGHTQLYVESDNQLKDDFLLESIGTFDACDQLNLPCKICLSEESEKDDFLMSPCLCRGHSGAVHLGCLKHWIDSNKQFYGSDNMKQYRFKRMKCQICKYPFPGIVEKYERKIPLLKMVKPLAPYIGLQRIQRQGEKKDIFFVNLSSNTFTDRYQIFPDILKHFERCAFYFLDQKLYIVDLDAKYGNLVKADREIQLKGVIKLQIAKTLYQLTYK